MPALDFAEPEGWGAFDADAVLRAYALSRPDGWPEPGGEDPRKFFSQRFTPKIANDPPGMLTGYYEPEVAGSLQPTADFCVPIHGPPPDWDGTGAWNSRAEILTGDLLAGQELVWLSSPIEAFLAQVQGSLRVVLPEGRVLRFGYSGRNGQPYRSVGLALIEQGKIAAEDMSAQAIRDWCARHPQQVRDLLNLNPSYVFFRPLDLPPEVGPIGAAGVTLTPMVSLAVDPAEIVFGSPVWVESDGPERLRCLMIAQDTGSAIRGPQRGDVFFGWGAAAGERAGRMSEPARLVPMFPKRPT